MKVNAVLAEIRQNQTTTEPNKYCLSIEAIGDIRSCDALLTWIMGFGEKKKTKWGVD